MQAKLITWLKWLILTLESSAFWLLRGESDANWLAFWSFHGLAALLCAVMAYFLLPRAWRCPQGIGLVVALALFFPGVGMLGLLLLVRFARQLPRVLPELQSLPELVVFPLSLDDNFTELKPGQSGRIARDPSKPKALRLKAVLALGELPPRVAMPVLDELLADPEEEIRLLAYSIADGWERVLTAELEKALALFQSLHQREGQSPNVAQAAIRVAELQLEFVYQNLARGDMRKFALQRALDFCQFAYKIQPDDTKLLLMALRVTLAVGRFDETHSILHALSAKKVSPLLWLPYAAELAWLERDFTRVSELLLPLSEEGVAPRLRLVLRTWQQAAGHSEPALKHALAR